MANPARLFHAVVVVGAALTASACHAPAVPVADESAPATPPAPDVSAPVANATAMIADASAPITDAGAASADVAALDGGCPRELETHRR